jgi:hypothetical protein
MREPKTARYNIRARACVLGVGLGDIINEINAQGIKCSNSEFSRAIYKKNPMPKDDRICELADKILKGWENFGTQRI